MPMLQTPAVPAGAVNVGVVGQEARRKRRLAEIADNLDLAAGPGGALVTDAELGAAVCREAVAVAQLAGPDVAPPWVGPALAPILAGINNLQAEINNLEAGQASLQAELKNQKTCHTNRIALKAPADRPQPYRPLAKVTAGFAAGPPIPAMEGVPVAAIAAVLAGPAPNPGPMAYPPAALPMLADTNDTMTQAEIGYLCRWYNDTMTIVAGDTHAVQLSKLKSFLCGL